MIRNLLNISEIEHRAAYLDGITTQPSIAGFNISIFACVCVIKFFKSEKTNQKMYLLFFLLGMSALLLTGKRTLFVGIVFCCKSYGDLDLILDTIIEKVFPEKKGKKYYRNKKHKKNPPKKSYMKRKIKNKNSSKKENKLKELE